MFEDHFNWPAANKTDTMYLGTIKNPETGFQKTAAGSRSRSSNLDISDIEKAKPYYQGYQYTQKETFANRNDDIAGSKPKKLHQPLEKVYYGLRNDDIAGTKPQCHKFVTTRSPINPLNPEYKLAQVEVRVPSPPRFIRDNIDIKDIDGAKPNPYTRYNIVSKTNHVEDIDGAKPRKEWIAQGKQSTLDVKDINYFWEFHTKRQTDPLSPRYKVLNEENKLIEYGQLDNKATIRHPKEVNKITSSDLRTTDIDGAQASTAVQNVNKLATRDTFMKTQDIPGAQTTTLKKGMTTTRQSNPLWPAYTIPGHSEPPPVYTRNMGTSQKFGGNTASDFGNAKKTQADQAWEHHNQILRASQAGETRAEGGFDAAKGSQSNVDFRKEADLVAAKERKPSGQKTPPAQIAPFQEDRKAVTAFARNGGEVLNSDKSFGAKTEYVPARLGGETNLSEANTRQKSSTKGFNLETKKALNSNEAYQSNVKNFFGLPAGDEKRSTKPLSVAEKFDRFIN